MDNHHYLVAKNYFWNAYKFVLIFSVKISISNNLTENLDSLAENFLSLLNKQNPIILWQKIISERHTNLFSFFSVKIFISNNCTENLNNLTENFLSLPQTCQHQYFVVKNDFWHRYQFVFIIFCENLNFH